MDSSLGNIIENCSVEDINRLKLLINEIETKKKQTNDKSVTLVKFKNDYEHYIKNNFSGSYLKSITLSFDHLIKYFGQDTPFTDITVRTAENFKDYLMQNAPLGYKIYMRNLHAAANKGVDWELFSTNPFAKIKLVKQQQKKPKFMKLEELKVVMDNTNSSVVAEIFLFAFYTAARPCELLKIRWGNIDLSQRIITVGDKNLATNDLPPKK